MTRTLFDPEQAPGPEPDPGPASPLTVSQVAQLITSTLERRMPSPLRVIGQVSSLNCQNHWFFSLKDETAVLRCVAWASAARGFGFVPEEGTEVVATGHVSHYGPQGRTQLYVRELKPVGAGALELKFRAMCDELRRLGYFGEKRKRPLPPFPRRIAVITSAGGAAVHDVIATAAERCPAVTLLIVDVRVQGEGAAAQIARAIRRVGRRSRTLGIDAILVTRGGGSAEDLWAFNERVVADAVYDCAVPVVAAIGHESDTTVIELVADARAATPTQAVMRLVPAARELHRQLDHVEHRLAFLTGRHLERLRQRLDAAARHVLFRDPAALLSRAGETLEMRQRDLRRAVRRRVDQRPALSQRQGRLGRAVTVQLRRARERVEGLGRQLAGVDPHGVLGRGYSYTTTADGRLVACVGDVKAGQPIVTRVSDGSIDSVVARTRSR